MDSDTNQKCFAQAYAIFWRMLRKGKPVAFEDAIRPVKTPDGFDRRAFGWIPAKMHHDGLIVPAGFRQSSNARHHCSYKRLWILATTSEKGGADHAK